MSLSLASSPFPLITSIISLCEPLPRAARSHSINLPAGSSAFLSLTWCVKKPSGLSREQDHQFLTHTSPRKSELEALHNTTYPGMREGENEQNLSSVDLQHSVDPQALLYFIPCFPLCVELHYPAFKALLKTHFSHDVSKGQLNNNG